MRIIPTVSSAVIESQSVFCGEIVFMSHSTQYRSYWLNMVVRIYYIFSCSPKSPWNKGDVATGTGRGMQERHLSLR